MSLGAVRFYNSIKDHNGLTQGRLIDLFAYHLLEDIGQPTITAAQLKECFEACDLHPPARISAHLAEGVKARPPRYLRTNGGYRLHRKVRDQLVTLLGAETHTIQIPIELRQLENSLPEGPRRRFLSEALDCFGVEANRAAIIMIWLLTLDHLFELIMARHLSAFNAVLAANNDRRVRVTAINQRDDFTEIPEGKFIEFCRTAGVITNDVRKILDEKLGTRNSAAHPSGVEFGRAKVIAFAEDLIRNVVLKYPI